jgi:hypothetical protein
MLGPVLQCENFKCNIYTQLGSVPERPCLFCIVFIIDGMPLSFFWGVTDNLERKIRDIDAIVGQRKSGEPTVLHSPFYEALDEHLKTNGMIDVIVCQNSDSLAELKIECENRVSRVRDTAQDNGQVIHVMNWE